MNHLSTVFLLAILSLLAACQSDAPANDGQGQEALPVSEALLGTWELIELEVDQVTIDGSDSSYTRFISEANWLRQYGVNPGRTTFTSDGKFVRKTRLANAEEVNLVHGLWQTLGGDSVRTIEPNIVRVLVTEFNATQDQFEWTGLVDDDNDGEADDSYRAKYRLVGRTLEAQ
ncbi:MAG: hypothetical protein AAF741_01820 [Bacteroidota bacterium]